MTPRMPKPRDPVARMEFDTYWDGRGMQGVIDVMFDGEIVHSSRMDEAAWPALLERILVWEAASRTPGPDTPHAMPDGKPFHLMLPGRTGPGLVVTRSGTSFLVEAGPKHALLPAEGVVAAARALGARIHDHATEGGFATGAAYETWRTCA